MLMRENIVILGSSGMAGHLLTQYLLENSMSPIVDIGPRHSYFHSTILADINDLKSLRDLILGLSPRLIINCVGVLVAESEEHKDRAIAINALLPHFLSRLCAEIGSKYFHISTDCVFSGKNGPYIENSTSNASDFYGKTKSLGESLGAEDLVIRTSIIGPELKTTGSGLFNWVMKQKNDVPGYRNVLWSGVTTLELAKYIKYLVTNNLQLSGLIHYSVSDGIAKLDLIRKINTCFGRKLQIIPVDQPSSDKRLINTRHDLGYNPIPYDEQISELKTWVISHPKLYPHYLEQI